MQIRRTFLKRVLKEYSNHNNNIICYVLKGYKAFPMCFKRVSKAFQKGFKRVSKRFKTFQKGFQSVLKEFQSISKGFHSDLKPPRKRGGWRISYDMTKVITYHWSTCVRHGEQQNRNHDSSWKILKESKTLRKMRSWKMQQCKNFILFRQIAGSSKEEWLRNFSLSN